MDKISSGNMACIKMETVDSSNSDVKDVLANLPMDELMGSVSCSDTDGMMEGKVRTSARVIKKMRFESELLEKKAEKREEKPEKSDKTDEPTTSSSATTSKMDIIKKCISPFWTSDEKNAFFESLNDAGKDFESIHNFLVAKMTHKFKKKLLNSDDYVKSKHQIRHFYYKTFHFISNYVKFSERLPKNVQELYALINYGAIRRKLGSVSKLSCLKLSDLIYNGTIAVKFKGKTVRVKTPMCKALRRLNKLDEKYDDLKLPTRVILELRPKNMSSFLKIQNLAQNPRVKMSVSLQKRLSTVLKCMGNRWRTAEALMYEKSLIPTTKLTKDLVPCKSTVSDAEYLLNPALRLRPAPDAHIELPAIDINDYFTGQSICLSAYEIRVGLKEPVKKEEPPPEYNPPQPVQNTPEAESVTEQKRRRLDAIRQGWTWLDCESLTVGELYLMFGADSKLVLEYSWDEPSVKSEQKPQYRDSGFDTINTVSEPLRKLLSLAKLQMTKLTADGKCTVCNGSGGRQFKKPQFTTPPPPPPTTTSSTHYNHHSLSSGKLSGTENAVDNSENKRAAEKMAREALGHAQNARLLQVFAQIHALQKTRIRDKKGGSRPTKQLVVARNLVPEPNRQTDHKIVSMNFVTTQINSEENSEDIQSHEINSRDRNQEVEGECTNDSSIIPEILPNDLATGLRSGSASPLPVSILKILRENDSQWGGATSSEMGDYSLSSLLGNLESQSKLIEQPNNNSSGTNATSSLEDSQLAQDVDVQLKKLLMENSVDFYNNFADLAEQVTATKK